MSCKKIRVITLNEALADTVNTISLGRERKIDSTRNDPIDRRIPRTDGGIAINAPLKPRVRVHSRSQVTEHLLVSRKLVQFVEETINDGRDFAFMRDSGAGICENYF